MLAEVQRDVKKKVEASGSVMVNPVRILIAAADGFENEFAIVKETIIRTRHFPVHRYRWAKGDHGPAQISRLDEDTPAVELDDFHGIIFLVAGAPDETADLKVLTDNLIRIHPADSSAAPRRRIMIYRLGGSRSAQVGAQGLRIDNDFAGTSDDFAERFWIDYQRRFRDFVDLALDQQPLSEARSVLLPTDTNLRSPYKGLKSYEKEDGRLFWGRSREVTELRNMLAERTHGFLIVEGPSGSGKSSLVRAGLFHRLKQGAIAGSAEWDPVPFDLKDHIEEPVLDLTPAGINTLLKNKPKHFRFILFIDQFEEVFTIWDGKNKQFLTDLSIVAKHPRVNVILTIRDDFSNKIGDTPLKDCPESRLPYRLYPVDEQGVLNAISLPAVLSGFEFEDRSLIMQISQDAGRPASLPLLSYALDRLAEEAPDGKLTKKAYEKIGGVKGAIQKQADEILDKFDQQRENVRALFSRLIAIDENGIVTKKPASVDATWKEEERKLKNELVDARLLVSSKGVIEIAHETLLNDWPFMKKWIADAKAALITKQEVEAAAKKWDRDLTSRTDPGQEARITIDKQLWPEDRLIPVRRVLRSLGAAGELSTTAQRFIRPETERLIEELALPIPHWRRFEIGERLAQLGDPRKGVGLENGLPRVLWCSVPTGRVKFSTQNGTEREFEVKPFYISRYPITVQQFNVFLQPENYKNEQWWAGLPDDPKIRTVVNEGEGANNPARYVSWYQAVAFCRWFSETLKYPVRIPTEWEWQQAATGGNASFMYPWGPDWDPNRANYREAKGSTLFAVGMYPEGRWPGGPYDMSGNVFEWCLNEFANPDSCELASAAQRTTRGGAYFSPPEKLSVQYRLNDNPDGINHFNNEERRIVVGIRLAADNPPLELVDV
jgi:formylglycine-generating enzyme required for sulfatase activity